MDMRGRGFVFARRRRRERLIENEKFGGEAPRRGGTIGRAFRVDIAAGLEGPVFGKRAACAQACHLVGLRAGAVGAAMLTP